MIRMGRNALFIIIMIVIVVIGLGAAMYFAYKENRKEWKKEKRKAK